MRRKVLQDFANVFCQRFIDLPSGYDLATFVHLGSGFYQLDILNGHCMRDGVSISSLMTCQEYRDWLQMQLAKRNIPLEALQVSMRIEVLISDVKVKTSSGTFLPLLFSIATATAKFGLMKRRISDTVGEPRPGALIGIIRGSTEIQQIYQTQKLECS